MLGLRLKRSKRGLTLIEICVVCGIIAILAGLSLYSLQSGKPKSPTLGMSYALVEEFRSARQLAIAKGHPVALAIPTDGGSKASTSIYRLSGWNVPRVEWARDYSGDYPGVSFAASTYGTGHVAGIDTSVISKFGAFDLTTWLPAQYVGDSIFCFTPDGGLITNDLPALGTDYTVVVGHSASFSASGTAFAANSATEARILKIGAFGGVRVVKDTTLSPGGAPSAVSPPEAYWEPPQAGGQDEIHLSNILVRPTTVGGDGTCQPGQTVNLEVFAYSPQGVELFARWTQSPNPTNISPDEGAFSYPSAALLDPSPPQPSKEMDRMEYLADFDPADFPEVNWPAPGVAPTGGVFRARWSYTVPLSSVPGDNYSVTVDVQNAQGTANIVNQPPAPQPVDGPPAGKMILEQLVGGVWQLVQMNPDGTGRRPLSPPGVEEFLPSIDRDGKNMAYLRGPLGARSVMTRTLPDGEPRVLAGPGNFTSVSISPNGVWVSYRDNTPPGTLINHHLGDNTTIDLPQAWGGTGFAVRKARSGWSWDSQHVIYGDDMSIKSYDLEDPTPPRERELFTNIVNGSVTEQVFCPTVYKDPSGLDFIIFSIGNVDPVLVIEPFDPELASPVNKPLSAYPTRPFPGASGSIDDDYPAVSVGGERLSVTRSPLGGAGSEDDTGQTLVVLTATDDGTGNFNMPQPPVPNVRRGFFIP